MQVAKLANFHWDELPQLKNVRFGTWIKISSRQLRRAKSFEFFHLWHFFHSALRQYSNEGTKPTIFQQTALLQIESLHLRPG